MVAKKGREQEVFDACAKWDLDVAIVGRVTDTGRFVCVATAGHDPLDASPTPRDPKVVVDLPIGLLADEAPKYDRPQKAPGLQQRVTGEMTAVPTAHDDLDLGAELIQLIGSPNIGSRAWIYRQYDHIVRDGTVVGPGQGDAAVVRVFCGDGSDALIKYLAVSVDCNGRHVYLDPFAGAIMAVAECARNITCVGGVPLGLTDCLNFGNPERPETMWRFAQAIDGLAEACSALNVPVVSGNVSLYNETDGVAILPTPSVAIVGQLRALEHRLTMAFANEGDVVAHLGVPSRGRLGGSEWMVSRTGKVSGEPVGIDLDAEVALQQAMMELSAAQLLSSAHDVSDGGLAACLAECALSGTGATVRLPESDLPKAATLFSEEPSRIVVSCSVDNRDAVKAICEKHSVPFAALGAVGGDRLTIEGCLDVAVADLAKAHRGALDAIVS